MFGKVWVLCDVLTSAHCFGVQSRRPFIKSLAICDRGSQPKRTPLSKKLGAKVNLQCHQNRRILSTIIVAPTARSADNAVGVSTSLPEFSPPISERPRAV